jgi:hypothetical protein
MLSMHHDHLTSHAKPKRGLSNPDPVIRRCRTQLAQAEKHARQILLAAGFEVEKLEADDTAYKHARRTRVRWHPPVALNVSSDVANANRLYDATDQAGYAFSMLRTVRLAREMMDDPHTSSAELLPLIYCFNLGIQFRRAELGLVFPETEVAFRKRKQKEAGAKPRQDALQQLIIEILRKKPAMTAQQMRRQLKGYERLGVIDSIDEAG